MLTDERLEEILMLAELASPGPWYYSREIQSSWVFRKYNGDVEIICTAGNLAYNGDFIAACNPEVIKSMVNELKFLRNELRER